MENSNNRPGFAWFDFSSAADNSSANNTDPERGKKRRKGEEKVDIIDIEDEDHSSTSFFVTMTKNSNAVDRRIKSVDLTS